MDRGEFGDFVEIAELMSLAVLPLWSERDEVGEDSNDSALTMSAQDFIGVGRELEELGFRGVEKPRFSQDPPFAFMVLERPPAVIVVGCVFRGVFVEFHLADSDQSGRFGAFPVLTAAGETVGDAMRRVVAWFVRSCGDALDVDPLPIAEMQTRLNEAQAVRQREVLTRHHRRAAERAWAAERHHAVVSHYERLADWMPLDAEEQRRLDTSRRALAAEDDDRVPVPLLAIVDSVVSTHHAVHAAYARRHEDGGVARWEDAAHRHRQSVEAFENHVKAIELSLQTSEASAVDAAVTFLEADPWCFRSGYAKGRLLQVLRRSDLTEQEASRIVEVVLHMVDVGGRLEFRDATRLARKIGGARLRTQLRDRLHGTDTDIARRALLALLDLRHPRLNNADVVAARRIVLDELHRRDTDPDGWGWPDWPLRIAGRVADDQWVRGLVEEIRRGGPDAMCALLILAELDRPSLQPADREMLGRLLIDAARGNTGFHWIEGIARHADSDAVRAELDAIVAAGEGDDITAAWWARGAIRRADEGSRP